MQQWSKAFSSIKNMRDTSPETPERRREKLDWENREAKKRRILRKLTNPMMTPEDRARVRVVIAAVKDDKTTLTEEALYRIAKILEEAAKAVRREATNTYGKPEKRITL